MLFMIFDFNLLSLIWVWLLFSNSLMIWAAVGGQARRLMEHVRGTVSAKGRQQSLLEVAYVSQDWSREGNDHSSKIPNSSLEKGNTLYIY